VVVVEADKLDWLVQQHQAELAQQGKVIQAVAGRDQVIAVVVEVALVPQEQRLIRDRVQVTAAQDYPL
jgi:hypothetical protein